MNSTIELTVRNKDIHIRKSDKITTGQQLNKIDIFFDGDSWIKTEKKENGNIDIIEELKVDIVFRIDNRFYRVTDEEEPMSIPEDKHLIIDIPPNVGASVNLGKVVFIGIRGTKKVGGTYQIVYPTPYFRLGVVEKGATPVDTIPPEKATQTAYDEAVEKADAAAKAAEQSKTSAEQSKANAKISETNAANSADAAKVSETNAKTSETNAANSAQEAGQYAEYAKTAVSEYPRIDSHGHWERYDPESGKWVDTGALAEFKIRKTYSTVAEMKEHWSDSDVFVNDFVMIAGEVEPENGELYVKLADSNTKYQLIGDISGAEGIQGPKGEKGDKGDQGPQGEQGPAGPAGTYTAGTGIKIENDIISATAEVYTAGDGISITNSSISARLGLGLKFDTEKKIALDESVEYTADEIATLYNDTPAQN